MTADIVQDLIGRAVPVQATVAYPEPADPRIVEAAARVAREGIARPVLVGLPEHIPAVLPPGVSAAAIEDGEPLELLAAAYAERRGVREGIARRLMRRPLLHAAAMVAAGRADGMVAGCAHTTTSVIQAAGLAIGYAPGVATASSCFIMVVPRLGEGRDVPLVFADCAVNPAPTPEDLAATAAAAASAARRLLGVVPRVAMLSFSTLGSAAHPDVDAVRQATGLAAGMVEDGFVEGELQFDTAVSPAVAARKAPPGGEVAGRANVLVFPDLNSGNIAYKAVQQTSGALAVGPILLGFARPVNDLSRGATVDEMVAITAITVLQGAGA